MKTVPLETPREGVIAFSSRMGEFPLLVRFSNEEDFYVFNGAWEGTYDGTSILIHRTKEIIPCEPFEEVVELTEDDRARLHFTGKIATDPLPEDDDDEIPY